MRKELMVNVEDEMVRILEAGLVSLTLYISLRLDQNYCEFLNSLSSFLSSACFSKRVLLSIVNVPLPPSHASSPVVLHEF